MQRRWMAFLYVQKRIIRYVARTLAYLSRAHETSFAHANLLTAGRHRPCPALFQLDIFRSLSTSEHAEQRVNCAQRSSSGILNDVGNRRSKEDTWSLAEGIS